MKNIYKPLVLLFTLLFFMLSLPLSASGEEENRFGREILGGMPSAAVLLTTYDELKSGCENLDGEIPLTQKITKISLHTVFSALISDYPEYFWLTGGYTYSQENGSDYVDSVSPEYLFARSKIAAAKSSLETMADKMLEGLNGKSDYDKALILHDRLAERVVYRSTSNDQTAYGAIVEGEAVCAGYARAYHYLLAKAGIYAWSIQGKSINPTTNQSEGHRWNMVKLDGKWYYSDVTWDDQGELIYHNYFNRTLSYFRQTHFPEDFSEYLPDDNSTALDYFKKNNLVFTKVDASRIVKLLKASGNSTNLYVDGDVNSFIYNLGDKMTDIVTSLGAKGGASYTYSTSKLGNEIFLSVIIEQKGHKHSGKQVAEIPASCYQTGVKEHFKCSCGRIFAEKSCKTEITSSEELVIAKTEHTPSGEWKSDKTAHWKYCTDCGADIDGSTSLHSDEDENLICDVCSAQSDEPFVKDEGGVPEEKELSLPPLIIGGAAGISIIAILIAIFAKKK